VLQKGGARCLLLESGPHVNSADFPRTEAEWTSQLYWGGGVEFDRDAHIGFLRARCVGGTTVINQALPDRFDNVALDSWREETGIDFFTEEAMAPYYDEAESAIAIQTMPDEYFTRNANIFIAGMEANGYKWERLRRGQSDCAIEAGNDCMGCLGGCHRDSKQSTLVTVIPKAVKEGLEIKSDFHVDRIEPRPGEVTIYGRHHDTAEVLRAPKVIVACGALGTTHLMLRSGFASRLPALGTKFCSHPQWMSFGAFDEPVNAHQGAFQTVCSKDPAFRKAGFKLENVFAGPIAVAMVSPQTGAYLHEYMRNYRFFSCVEVAIRDEAVGRMTLGKKGRLVVHKNFTDQDLHRREMGLNIVKEVFISAGAKEVVQSPFAYSLHLMGGCSIGTDAISSVVNERFQVHGHDNLYISDSSVYPNAPGINPALTVMALTRRMCHELLN